MFTFKFNNAYWEINCKISQYKNIMLESWEHLYDEFEACCFDYIFETHKEMESRFLFDIDGIFTRNYNINKFINTDYLTEML